eukprot:7548189-Pyramimonas_sp.AAC.1
MAPFLGPGFPQPALRGHEGASQRDRPCPSPVCPLSSCWCPTTRQTPNEPQPYPEAPICPPFPVGGGASENIGQR